MKLNNFVWLFAAFTLWRLAIFIFSIAGLYLIQNQSNFLGGGLDSYLQNPFFWGWGNFDGEHYLAIAHHGYAPLTYFYFPLYPFLTNLVTIGNSFASLHLSALIISHVSFFISLVGLWKLLALDYKDNTVKTAIVCLLLFPTSFYFAANYTESLFLATIVWSFYFARRSNWFASGIFGALSSATRIVGIALIPSFLIENFYTRGNRKKINIVYIALVSVGFISYVFFMWRATGNPLEFNRGSELFGEYRSQSPLFLPQVIYRYIFKIIPNLSWNYFPSTFAALLEFTVGIMLTVTALIGVFRLRLSYWIFLIASFFMPMMYNGFVSLPRYALVIFPLYIYLALWVNKKSFYFRIAYYAINFLCLCAATILFTRGYWVS